jgi:tripeptide aminopeptidase
MLSTETATPPIQTDRLLARFLRYVRIDTAANPNRQDYPSSEGQLKLGRILADELTSMGLADVQFTEDGLVISTIPATVAGDIPVVGLVAHVDTSPEAPSAEVNPQVVEITRAAI